ncbi:MAG: L-lactate dehydrogenase [Rickettsiales bacterium]|jgi:L-lactate dehydrogenase|nr:L-lactate dehydrogenase [Rickettsiales bacterium]
MKIGIIGTGSVGGAIARDLVNSGLATELALLDIDQTKAIATAEDLTHASVFGADIKIAAGSYANLKNSDIIIITAGARQQEGESRVDLVERNTRAMLDIVPKLMPYVDKSKVIIIPVTNPLDVMTQVVHKISGLPAARVIGTGTILDSARFRALLAKHLGVSHKSIHCWTLGEHGDSQIVNWTGAMVGAVPLVDFCEQTKIPLTDAVKKTIEYKTINAAYSIIKGRNATWDGIGAAATDLVRSIALDDHRILPVSITTSDFLPEPVAFSLPRIITRGGVAASIYPKLSSYESKSLRQSAKKILSLYSSVS